MNPSTAVDPGSLSNLRGIVEPSAVSVWPLAPGVWALLALVVIWLTVAGVLWWRHRRRNAYRRAALRELATIRQDLGQPAKRNRALLALPSLVKRVALAAFPRAQVAPLSGEAWIQFLNRTSRRPLFAGSPGQLLAGIPYIKDSELDEIPDQEVRTLLHSVARWIRKHRPEVK